MDNKADIKPNSTMANSEDEVEINLSSLLAYILRKWKSIVLVAVVFAVSLVGGKYALDAMDASTKDYSDEAYESLLEQMGDSDIQEVEDLFDQYLSYLQQIDDFEYNYVYEFVSTLSENGMLAYKVEYSYVSDYPNTEISFSAMTLGNDEYSEIASILGIEDEDYYQTVSSLVSIYGSDTLDGGDSEETSSLSSTSLYQGMLYFEVLGYDQETCEEIADIVKSSIQDHLNELQDAGINIVLTEVSSNEVDAEESVVISNYQEVLDDIALLEEEMDEYFEERIAELNTTQSKLFELLVAKNDQNTDATVSINVTMALLGFVIGFFFMLIIYVILYLFNGSIKDEDEAIKIVDRPLFATLYVKKSYKGLNGLFMRWSDSLIYGNQNGHLETQKYLLVEKLVAYAKQHDAKKIFVIVDSKNEAISMILDEIMENDLMQEIELRWGNPFDDSADFAALKESAICVYAVQLWKTQRKSILRNVNICREFEKKIIGVLTIGEL